ncbi:hypothetical protein FF38_00076 [Lucilia cuprina]|uniref:Uncharacterized protein n=1 Tax=Lucilia cuprina TaxID=7375 RepID=A0A0L0BX15_LUCCU|nr:hypothetical protein FF38_00076 [Lucilia cuprina]
MYTYVYGFSLYINKYFITFSLTAIFCTFHKNSQIPITTAIAMPPIKTTNRPPTDSMAPLFHNASPQTYCNIGVSSKKANPPFPRITLSMPSLLLAIFYGTFHLRGGDEGSQLGNIGLRHQQGEYPPECNISSETHLPKTLKPMDIISKATKR